MSDPVVSPAWLAARLGDPGVQIIDATWFMPGDPRSGRAEYEAGHIPGAVFFDIDAVSDQATDLPHMLPTPADSAAALGALGLRQDATVVVYDGHGVFSAPRVWWHLRTAGFETVRVLDGGLPAWRETGGAIVTGPQPAIASTQVPAIYDPALVRDLFQVQANLNDGRTQLVDARAAGRFTGAAPEPRAGLPSGHMPGALNLPWGDVLADGRLKSKGDLRATFDAAGVDLAQPIVATCGSGVSAAILALGLARLGLPDIPIYDGSWTEWASRPDAKIVTG